MMTTEERKAKRRARDIRWRAENPERVAAMRARENAKRKARREAQGVKPALTEEQKREKLLAYRRAYYAKNKERLQARGREYYHTVSKLKPREARSEEAKARERERWKRRAAALKELRRPQVEARKAAWAEKAAQRERERLERIQNRQAYVRPSRAMSEAEKAARKAQRDKERAEKIEAKKREAMAKKLAHRKSLGLDRVQPERAAEPAVSQPIFRRRRMGRLEALGKWGGCW